MNAALRFAEAHAALRPSFGPSFRASMRPTLVPSSCAMSSRVTETPSTQRSATVHPRFEAAARQEAQSVLASMRLNADFLIAILYDNASPIALDALEDLRRGIHRLEQRFASSSLGLRCAR